MKRVGAQVFASEEIILKKRTSLVHDKICFLAR